MKESTKVFGTIAGIFYLLPFFLWFIVGINRESNWVQSHGKWKIIGMCFLITWTIAIILTFLTVISALYF